MPDKCPHCGFTYAELRTGYTFGIVRDMMFVCADDPSQWRQKRRNGVLGFWRELKQGMWREHLVMCRKG